MPCGRHREVTPQNYTLWRRGGREQQLELRPGVFITTVDKVDVSLETASSIPVLEMLSLRVGTRIYSYDWQTVVGFNAGLSAHFQVWVGCERRRAL